MANRDTPIGFRPAHGVGVQHVYSMMTVDSGNGTNLFVGDVTDFDGTGTGPAAADAGVSVNGVVVGLFDSAGNPVGHPNSTVSTKYLPLSTAGLALIALAIPGAQFIAQGQSSQSTAASNVGATTDHVAGTGDTTTARSRHELNISDLNTGAQFRIVNKVNAPNNDWDEDNTDLYVTFNESAFNSTATGA